MARKMTIDEKLQKLKEEEKALKQKQREEKRKEDEVLFQLLGKALRRYFQKKEGSEEGANKKMLSLFRDYLPKSEREKLIKLLKP